MNDLKSALAEVLALVDNRDSGARSDTAYYEAVRFLSENRDALLAMVGDAERLDALEAEVAEGGPITLHNGEGANGGRGLGLANTGRTLRQAIDQCCGLDAALAGRNGDEA